MISNDVFRRFQWQDRRGLTWKVVFYNHEVGFSGFGVPSQGPGTSEIQVRTHDGWSRKQSMAYLHDVRVDSHIENRGMGSMLVREAIEECARRGHEGMYGYLSELDSGHFQKLKYFYEKLGFSVSFYDPSRPDYRYDQAGKIEMTFSDHLVDKR